MGAFYTYLPMKMEQMECSETSTYKIQMPGNYTEENIQHTEHGESLKSRIFRLVVETSSGGTKYSYNKLLSIIVQQDATMYSLLYRVILSLEAPSYCL
jgi:hypothetical protein